MKFHIASVRSAASVWAARHRAVNDLARRNRWYPARLKSATPKIVSTSAGPTRQTRSTEYGTYAVISRVAHRRTTPTTVRFHPFRRPRFRSLRK